MSKATQKTSCPNFATKGGRNVLSGIATGLKTEVPQFVIELPARTNVFSVF